MPATIPNIAINPLKRSTPEFITNTKIHPNYLSRLVESGIPNDLIYAWELKNQTRI